MSHTNPGGFSKRLASATLQLTISNATVRLFSIVTMPILTRMLSPDAYGTAALAGTLISLISVVALAGMDMSYARAYHATLAPSGHAAEAFAWRYTLGTGLVAACISAIAWRFVFADALRLPSYLAGLLGIGVLLSIANSMAQTRARLNNRYGRMSFSIVASAVGMASASIGVALWRRDELPIILSLIVGYLIPVAILGIPNVRVLGNASGLSQVDRVNIFKIGLAGIVTAPMYWIISSLDRWFLGYFWDSATVGVYSIGYSIAVTGMMMNSALMAVWLPEASREYEQNPMQARALIGANTSRIIVLLALVWMGVVAAGGDIVRLLTDQRYHAAAQFIPYIAGGVFFYGICQLALGILILKQKLNIAIWWWLAGGAICCMLNAALIPIHSGLGAAITQTVSLAFIGIGIFASSVKIVELNIGWSSLIMAVSIVLFSGILMKGAWSTEPPLSLLLKFPVGVLISAAAVRIAAPGLLSKGLALMQAWRAVKANRCAPSSA